MLNSNGMANSKRARQQLNKPRHRRVGVRLESQPLGLCWIRAARLDQPYEELVRKCAGTSDFFLSSIFSCQTRTGNFLSLERSERKELFIRELLGLDRLRLIAAAAKDKGDKVARTTLGLDGQAKSLRELVEAGVENPAEVEARLAEVSSRLETLEANKRAAQQRLLELEGTSGRKRA